MTKKDLEEFSKQNAASLHELQSSISSKVEKFQKTAEKSFNKAEIITLYSKQKETEKSHDLLISKLVQLEQRLSLLEEADSVSETLHFDALKNKTKPGHSQISDLGSHETDSTAQYGSLSKKDQQKTSYEDLIFRITEDFIG